MKRYVNKLTIYPGCSGEYVSFVELPQHKEGQYVLYADVLKELEILKHKITKEVKEANLGPSPYSEESEHDMYRGKEYAYEDVEYAVEQIIKNLKGE